MEPHPFDFGIVPRAVLAERQSRVRPLIVADAIVMLRLGCRVSGRAILQHGPDIVERHKGHADFDRRYLNAGNLCRDRPLKLWRFVICRGKRVFHQNAYAER
jgi:hypothetical protein